MVEVKFKPLEDFITYDSRVNACVHLLARGRFCIKKLSPILEGECSDCELFERKEKNHLGGKARI